MSCFLTRARELSTQLSSLLLIVLAWGVAAAALDTSALPSPVAVFDRLIGLVFGGGAYEPLYSTFGRTFSGFLLGFALGIAYGIGAALSRWFDELTRWLLQIAIFTPTLILIFLFLIAIGRTDISVIVLIGIVVLPIVGTYIRDSLKDFDPELDGMAQSFKAGLLQRVKEMYLPFLIPPMLASGRIGFTLAWKVAFLSEIFGFPNGLGWQVKTSYDIYDITTLLAWLGLFIVVLLLVEQVMRFLERRIVKW